MTSQLYRSEWYIPGQLLYSAVWGKPTINDIMEYLVHCNELSLTSESSFVHFITDYSFMLESAKLVDLSRTLPKAFAPNPRIGWSVTIGEINMLTKMSTSFGGQYLKIRQRTFPTFEQGLAFLRETCDTLDWDKADPTVPTRVLPSREEVYGDAV